MYFLNYKFFSFLILIHFFEKLSSRIFQSIVLFETHLKDNKAT